VCLNDGTTIALPSGQTMETIPPIPQTRLKMPDAPPDAAPENPPEGFAQVMARQENFNRPKETPAGWGREGAGPGPKTLLSSEEKTKQESPDPANDPEAAARLSISPAVPPSPLNRPWEPPLDLETPTFPQKLEALIPNPALASTEQIGSSIQAGPGVAPQDSLLPEPTEGSKVPGLLPGLLAGDRTDFRITGKIRPVSVQSSVHPEETLKENPEVSGAFEERILFPAPESLTIKQEASPETTEIARRSSPTTMDNSPSFSPQGPAIAETASAGDGPDPSPSLILPDFALKGLDSATTALEIKPDPQAASLKALSRTEKIAPAPMVEEPPNAEAGPLESNSPTARISAAAASPAASKEMLSDRGISSPAKAEGLPDPERPSPALTGKDPETSFLPRTSSEKVEPGIALQYHGENPAGVGGPERNNPIQFQDDPPLGFVTRFPDQIRVEGLPAERSVEGPLKGSAEWTKEALSVYQQFSKGLLRTLQHGGDRIQMTLNPPQLGNLLLEINRDRNSVTAHLWTDSPRTKELLDFSQGQLQKTLELDGFKLDRFEVLVQSDLKSFQEERGFGGRQPAWENTREGERRVSPEGILPATPKTATLRFSQGNQYVDTWV
jgi:hypothetical protein